MADLIRSHGFVIRVHAAWMDGAPQDQAYRAVEDGHEESGPYGAGPTPQDAVLELATTMWENAGTVETEDRWYRVAVEHGATFSAAR